MATASTVAEPASPRPDSGTDVVLSSALDSALQRALAPVARGLGVLYVVFGVAHLALIPGPWGPVMSVAALSSAAVLFATAGQIRSRRFDPRLSHPIAAAIAALPLANTLLHLVLFEDPHQTTGLLLLVLGVGMLFTSARWLAAVLGATAAGWVAAVAVLPPSPDWVHFGFALLSATVLAVLLHIVNTRNLRRLETLRLLEEQRRKELEQGRELLEQRVAQRTAELLASNQALTREMAGRERVEELLRRSEEYHRSIIENVEDVISLLDADGRIRYESPSLLRTFGYRPEELVGRNALELVHPDDRDRARHALAQVASVSGAVGLQELRFLNRAGEWRIIEVVGRNLLDNESVGAVIIVTRDVTERRRVEEQLAQAQKMEAVGRLAGGVAHDFNNLLTTITGHAELLLQDLGQGDERTADVEAIRVAAEHAARLTRQLLAFGRKQVLQPAHVDAAELLQSAERVLRQAIRPDVRLEVRPAIEPCPVFVDRRQIEGVLLHLVLNAQDAVGPSGSILISARRELREAGTYVVLRVTDTGVGMDEAVKSRIFEPFFTTKEQGKGTGLGLSTVYGIVQQSGGFVEVDSNVGHGTTFRIYLPQVEESNTVAGAPASAPAAGPPTILLAEDDHGVRELATTILSRDGFRVVVAKHGLEALSLYQQEAGRVTMIISDVMMPGMSGPEFVSRVRTAAPNIPVLYLSGYTGELVFQEGHLSAGSAFLQKPFAPETLLTRVREMLDSQS